MWWGREDAGDGNRRAGVQVGAALSALMICKQEAEPKVSYCAGPGGSAPETNCLPLTLDSTTDFLPV